MDFRKLFLMGWVIGTLWVAGDAFAKVLPQAESEGPFPDCRFSLCPGDFVVHGTLDRRPGETYEVVWVYPRGMVKVRSLRTRSQARKFKKFHYLTLFRVSARAKPVDCVRGICRGDLVYHLGFPMDPLIVIGVHSNGTALVEDRYFSQRRVSVRDLRKPYRRRHQAVFE